MTLCDGRFTAAPAPRTARRLPSHPPRGYSPTVTAPPSLRAASAGGPSRRRLPLQRYRERYHSITGRLTDLCPWAAADDEIGRHSPRKALRLRPPGNYLIDPIRDPIEGPGPGSAPAAVDGRQSAIAYRNGDRSYQADQPSELRTYPTPSISHTSMAPPTYPLRLTGGLADSNRHPTPPDHLPRLNPHSREPGYGLRSIRLPVHPAFPRCPSTVP